jgi:hypothetical protein
MKKLLLSLTLAVFLITPSVFAALDLSPYEELVSDISQKESEIQSAREMSDWDSVIRLGRELDSLKSRMSTPQMQVLAVYSYLNLPMSESEYLISQLNQYPEGGHALEARSAMESVSLEITALESLYQNQDYSNSLASLNTALPKASSLPSSISGSAAQAIAAFKLESGAELSISKLQMLDNARSMFFNARSVYDKASASLLAGNYDKASKEYAEGRAIAEEAFLLVSRTKDSEFTLSDESKLLLIIAPFCLLIILLLYFKIQFKKSIVKSTISKLSFNPGAPIETERNIEFLNLEKTPMPVKISDSPPLELNASDFSMEPTETEGSNLVWAFEADHGKTIVNYKLKGGPFEPRTSIKIPAAHVSYVQDGIQKKYYGSPAEIKIN